MFGLAHHHQHHFLHLTEVGRLYWSHSLRGFAMSLVGVFIPIYLLKLGYSLQDVVLFFAAASLVQAVFLYPAMQLTARIGGHRTMAIGILLSVVHFMSLITLPIFNPPLWVLAFLLDFLGALLVCSPGYFHKRI